MKIIYRAGLLLALATLSGCYSKHVEKRVVTDQPPVVVERTVPRNDVIIEEHRTPVIREGHTTVIEH